MTILAASADNVDAHARPTFDEVYAEHVAFVWRVLRALGVAPHGIEDAAQDVFVIVHRRLPEFEGRSAITTWLFAIARRVAYRHRRKQKRAPIASPQAGTADPHAAAERGEAAAIITAALERLDDDKRIVFALVELEQIAVAEVARMLHINVNTAYSRLRLARSEVTEFVRRTRSPK